MPAYLIRNTDTGHVCGTYEARNGLSALLALVRAAGYKGREAEDHALELAARPCIEVTEVSVKECLYCGRDVSVGEAIAAEHSLECEWTTTAAFTREVSR